MNDQISQDNDKILFLVRGIPGSRRGLVALRLADDWPVISADDYFMEDTGAYNFDGEKLREAHLWCQHKCEEYMKSACSKIFISNTFVQAWELTPYYLLAKAYRYMVHVIIVENRNRGTTDKVPSHTAERMRSKFDIEI